MLTTVHVQGLGDLAIDLLVPTGIVRGRLVSSRPTVEGLRVLAVPTVPTGGSAAALLASPKFARVTGVPSRTDGSFEVQHVADGTSELQVRDGTTIMARRPITVHGSLDVGDWSIDG